MSNQIDFETFFCLIQYFSVIPKVFKDAKADRLHP